MSVAFWTRKPRRNGWNSIAQHFLPLPRPLYGPRPFLEAFLPLETLQWRPKSIVLFFLPHIHPSLFPRGKKVKSGETQCPDRPEPSPNFREHFSCAHSEGPRNIDLIHSRNINTLSFPSWPEKMSRVTRSLLSLSPFSYMRRGDCAESFPERKEIDWRIVLLKWTFWQLKDIARSFLHFGDFRYEPRIPQSFHFQRCLLLVHTHSIIWTTYVIKDG